MSFLLTPATSSTGWLKLIRERKVQDTQSLQESFNSINSNVQSLWKLDTKGLCGLRIWGFGTVGLSAVCEQSGTGLALAGCSIFLFWLVQLLCLAIGPFWAGWASTDCLHIRFVQFFQGSTIRSRKVSQKRACCCFIRSVIRSGWRRHNLPENFPVSQQKGSIDEMDYKWLWKWVQATPTMLQFLFYFFY